MPDPIVKIRRGSSTPSTITAGELAMDLVNKTLFVGTTAGTPLAIGGEGTFATITYVNSAISSSVSGLGSMAFQNSDNVTITGGTISAGTITGGIGAFTTLTIATAPSANDDAVRKTDLDSAISALGSVFHLVGDTSLATTPFDLGTLPDQTTGSYYIVAADGTYTATGGYSQAAKVGDSFVKTTTSWQKLDNVDAAVTGTTNEIVVTGSENTGFAVGIASAFKTRVSDLETKTQNIDLTATTGGSTVITGNVSISGYIFDATIDCGTY